MVYVTEDLKIPERELDFSTSRSGGPGGQNVNKVNTRVTLLWNVRDSPSISEEQREKLLDRLRGRINRDGVMRVVSQKHRTQWANREAARRRFADLVSAALLPEVLRVPVAVSKGADKDRLERKRRRGRLKRERRAVFAEEED